MEENKDYIINLRVSRKTYDKIRERAKENRDTVSNLVRKTLEDGLEILSDLSQDILGKESHTPGIVSYHKVQLAQEVKCANCGSMIEKGSPATVGETKSGKKHYFCAKCK